MIANSSIGGDSCHRGAVMGSILGAQVGEDGIAPHLLLGLVEGSQISEGVENWASSSSRLVQPSLENATP